MEYDITLTNEAAMEIANAADCLRNITDVSSDAGARAADAVVKPAKTLVKIVHDQRMAVSRKVDAVKKQLIAKENEICADLNAEIERVSKLASDYLAKKLAEQAKAAAEREAELAAVRASAQAEAALTGQEVQVAEAPADDEVRKPVDGVSSRTTWTFDIVDSASVPRAYCVPDMALIRAYMTEAKKSGAKLADLSIPGVRFRAEVRI